MDNKGKLYICPTPIGNLEDITIRVLNTLKEVDLIAAEDTRHTIKLLNYFDIHKPMTSYHEHNEKEKGPSLINKIINGESIALVSDAGMPGISDPGERLIKLAINEEITIEVLPGATASIVALVTSGLSTDKFVFEGFLPSTKKDRRERLSEIQYEDRTLIIYEAPHRLLALLKDMTQELGDRRIAVARELTKKYQEIFRGTVEEAIEKFEAGRIRGEFVIVVQGQPVDEQRNQEVMWEDISIKEHISLYMNQGISKKDAIKRVAVERDIPKKEVYKEGISIEAGHR